MNNDGPTLVNVPAQQYKTCSGCKHLNHTMVHSGRDPKYANNCNHPQCPRPKSPWDGNIPEHFTGRIVTPDWCPVLNNQKNKG